MRTLSKNDYDVCRVELHRVLGILLDKYVPQDELKATMTEIVCDLVDEVIAKRFEHRELKESLKELLKF